MSQLVSILSFWFYYHRRRLRLLLSSTYCTSLLSVIFTTKDPAFTSLLPTVHICTLGQTPLVWKLQIRFCKTRFRAASGGPRSPFGFEEAFKGGRCIQGGKFFKKADNQTDRHTMRFLIRFFVIFFWSLLGWIFEIWLQMEERKNGHNLE